MSGYQWSIWYIPENWKTFMRDYNMKHVPHLTIETNIPIKPTTIEAELCLKRVEFKSGLVKIPSQYNEDTSTAIGWFCETSDKWTRQHRPHITWKYDYDIDPPTEKPATIHNLFLAIADTRSSDPTEWKFFRVPCNI